MSVRSEVVGLIDPLVDGRVSADDEPRGGMEHPYAIVVDHVSETAIMRGDLRALAWRRTLQVSLFQTLEDEDPHLLDTLLDALDGAEVDGATHLSVTSSLRTPDPDPGVVHHAITCSVARLRG